MSALWDLLAQVSYVDLTHTFDTQSPHFPLAVPMEVETVRTIERDGYLVQRFHLEGQWGTHVDAPSHFFQGFRSLEAIEVSQMVCPLVVLDVHEKVRDNPDYAVSIEDIVQWEERWGIIPQAAFVALRTDWSHRWPDNEKMHNRDVAGISHTPGWSLAALRYLYEERHICACGHETIDTDPGKTAASTLWECERYVLGKNSYQIEMLANLDKCPEYGGIVVASFPKARGASGFAARVFAIIKK